MNQDNSDLGLVMSGGGARAAYQVGLLRYIGRHFPSLNFPVITGVSAGAINAAFIANQMTDFHQRCDQLADIWINLSIDKVFDVNPSSIARHVFGWGLRLISGRASRSVHIHGMVDTDPLREFLQGVMHPEDGRFAGVEQNLANETLRALAITGSSYSTGQSITWVQGKGVENWERAHRKSVLCDLSIEHIMASASLPMFFPSVQVDGKWYGDGGIRLTAPLSPAIHLGARRLLAISTRHLPDIDEKDQQMIDDYPPPAQVFGSMLTAIFLDVFDNDALRLERINDLITKLPAHERMELHPIKLLLLRPSRDLGKLANEYEAQLPGTFRFMTRGLGTKETRSNDMLSMVMFQSDYIQHMIELGEKDGADKIDEITAFLSE